MAQDFVVLEEHDKAGVIIGTWDGSDASILEKIPGVVSVLVRPNVIEEGEPTAQKLQRTRA